MPPLTVGVPESRSEELHHRRLVGICGREDKADGEETFFTVFYNESMVGVS